MIINMKVKFLVATALLCCPLSLSLASPKSTGSVKKTFGKTTPVDFPVAVAHRGCWLREADGEYYIPENSLAGVRMARRYGYPAIECDVKYTKDSVMVIMHDGTINRTMRNASDYSRIGRPVRVSETTFEELRKNYVLESSDPALRTPIPTLEEMLLECKAQGIVPMLHSAVVESYGMAARILGDRWIAFDASEQAVSQSRRWSKCLILLDPGSDPAAKTVERLKGMGGWCGMSTMNYKMLNSEYIGAVKEAGFEVQASIFPAPNEWRAAHDKVSIQLSDFWWYQTKGRKPSSKAEVRAGGSVPRQASHSVDALEFGAVTLSVDFFGAVELTVTDGAASRTYLLTSNNPSTEEIGFRVYKGSPNISVKVSERSAAVVTVKTYKL